MEHFREVRVGHITLRIREVLLHESNNNNDSKADDDDDDDDCVDAMFFQPSWSLAAATGSRVWDSCDALVQWLIPNAVQYIKGKRVLELGAGCGLTGLACACLGARQVVLTDVESVVLYSTVLNVDANKGVVPCPVSCKTLDWFDPAKTEEVDVVLASDCVWLRELVPPFCNTLASLLRANEGSVALVAQLERANAESTTFASTQYLLTNLAQAHLDVTLLQDGKTQIFCVSHQ